MTLIRAKVKAFQCKKYQGLVFATVVDKVRFEGDDWYLLDIIEGDEHLDNVIAREEQGVRYKCDIVLPKNILEILLLP